MIDGSFWADIKKTGNYTLMIDSVGPSLQQVRDGSSPQGKTIRFVVKDKLNGIDSWRIEVDGKWVLSEYDRKTAVLQLPYSELKALGKARKLRLSALDKIGNESVLNISFTY